MIELTQAIIKELNAMTPEKRRDELLYLIQERTDETPELDYLKSKLAETEQRIAWHNKLAAEREQLPVPELYLS